MESKRENLLQIFRIEKAFGIWKACLYPLRKCPATSMGICGTEFCDVKKAQYGWTSNNCVSCELHVVESGFIAQI